MIAANDENFFVVERQSGFIKAPHVLKLNADDTHGQGAEMIFASSVLLVEGEGDWAFFEGLRRRLAEQDETGRVDNLFVIHVGGKSNFAPWIKLLLDLRGGSTDGGPAYLVVPDGDATSEIQQAFNESNISIPREALTLMQNSQ
jgi:predicted ATP-dependent endonuclease of OLD family